MIDQSMTDNDQTPTGVSVDELTAERKTSRKRRTYFAFGFVFLAWAGIMALARFHMPVSEEISIKAIDTLGFFATMIGAAWLGGSILDLSPLVAGLAGKFGVNLPAMPQPNRDSGGCGGDERP